MLNNLSRPLCLIDIEATGLNIIKDRIIEIYILKILPNHKKIYKYWLINPGISIPKKSTLIHGIKNKDIKNQPLFKVVSHNIFNTIKGSDLLGYNSNKFDIPILAEEMIRSKIPFDISKHKCIDIQIIFHKMVPRTLSAAYKYYCKKELLPHKAKNDVLATYEIFKGQLKKYKKLKNKTINQLEKFTSYNNILDPAGFIIIDNKKNEKFNFGKYKGKKIKNVFKTNPKYYYYIQKSNFPLYTKKVFTILKFKYLNN
ncbi:MAG: 3'-5' exonuclease [Candidatus Shikimatogenerans bostrichidophilus]|nr:MAG: 3'-5' exonuclease [Candidatus Shikimatogenerans bostrichidophilus]